MYLNIRIVLGVEKVSDGSNISYDTLKQFKYEALEAERDDFSRTKNQLGSKFLVDLLKDGLSDQDKLKIEKEYSHFFESLKKISDINDIINWQDTSELKEAKKFFSHINILPNMPPIPDNCQYIMKVKLIVAR